VPRSRARVASDVRIQRTLPPGEFVPRAVENCHRMGVGLRCFRVVLEAPCSLSLCKIVAGFHRRERRRTNQHSLSRPLRYTASASHATLWASLRDDDDYPGHVRMRVAVVRVGPWSDEGVADGRPKIAVAAFLQNTSTLSAHSVHSVTSSSELRRMPSARSASFMPRASMQVPHTPMTLPRFATALSIVSTL